MKLKQKGNMSIYLHCIGLYNFVYTVINSKCEKHVQSIDFLKKK